MSFVKALERSNCISNQPKLGQQANALGSDSLGTEQLVNKTRYHVKTTYDRV